MFGGVEQLLRDSQDWVFQDQAQLATGFENWGPGFDLSGLGQSPVTGDGNGGAMMPNHGGAYHAAGSPDGYSSVVGRPGTHDGRFPPQTGAGVVGVNGYGGGSGGNASGGGKTLNGAFAAGVFDASMTSYDEREWYQ